ncbi:hypothetical protein H0G86_010591 [Trichoderma simmonsii]|uniref:Nucleoside phosphorylase domain-containing protein n=1 Tax=Trichoderma simmonsii TaxID=1491479 RepID=A0A8G0LQ28_9HYPO|nr:hypothetical protein H0G86_010591 [Trichoderma simmonsii]
MAAESKRRDIFKPAFATVEDTSAQYGRDIEDLKNLPDEFIQVNQCFLVAKDTLSYARKNATWDESSTEIVQPFATSLKTNAEKLQKIFSQVGKQMDDDSYKGSVLDCYRDTLIKLGKLYRVEVLMLSLLKDLDALFTEDLLKAEDYMKIDELRDAIETLSKVESSVPDSCFPADDGANSRFAQHIASGGTGYQSNHTGQGDQISTGGGAYTRTVNNYMMHYFPRQVESMSSETVKDTTAQGRPQGRQAFQIAIICALPLEYDAVSLLFDQFWDENESYGRALGDMNSYTTGRMGKYNVVLALLPETGTISAAAAAASFRTSYPGLELAFSVGICGGVPWNGVNEIHLGDVIISKSAVQYDLGKQYPTAFVTRDTTENRLGRPNKNIRNLIASFETEFVRERLQKSASLHLKTLQDAAARKRRRYSYRYPGVTNDNLFSATYRHKHRRAQPCSFCDSGEDDFCKDAARSSCAELGCDETQLVKRTHLEWRKDSGPNEEQYLEIFIGRMASGSQLMKSGEHRDKIAQQYDVIAFEMEGAGLWDEVPCIIIKGVSDYADSHNNDIWRPYATAAAVAVMKAALGRYTMTDR